MLKSGVTQTNKQNNKNLQLSARRAVNGLRLLGQVHHAEGQRLVVDAVGVLCHQAGGVPFLLQGCEATLKETNRMSDSL